MTKLEKTNEKCYEECLKLKVIQRRIYSNGNLSQ